MRQKVKELKDQGLSNREIARKLGISHPTVENLLQSGKKITEVKNLPPEEETDIPPHHILLDPDEIARKVMEGYQEEETEEEQEEEKPKKRNQPNVGRPKEKVFDALEELEIYANEMQALTWRIVSKFGHDKAIDILNQLLYQVEKNIFEDIKVSL